VAKKGELRASPRVARDLAEGPAGLVDETDITDAILSGDYSGLDITLAEITACRLDHAQFTSTRLARTRLVDCLVVDSDFSGVLLEECRLTRVEFRGCRLAGLQAASVTFGDVGFFDCKMSGANFRMTVWERAEFHSCDLVDADFYGAKLPGSRFQGCDLSDVELSKSALTGSRLHGSSLDRIRGGDALRGVTIGSDQIIPTALAIFGSLNISVRDDQD
jgi:uncharacterized protein YjbI with pentapeptide repeats